MVKISKIKINRFRSIMEMSLKIDQDENIISICGANNVGKTNTLRALNLFFNPNIYDPKIDIPTFKKATWGGAVHPKIAVEFIDSMQKKTYLIIRDFQRVNEDNIELSGSYYKHEDKRNKVTLDKEELEKFMDKIQFYFIESVNLVIPDIINKITDDMISLQYDKSRFTKSKQELRDAYMTYTNGLQEVLDIFAKDISESFNRFRENWNVVFNVPKSIETFRDLISDDVTLTIKDNGSNGIVEKGSGLQRLALIILFFEISQRILDKKTVIICIDEPDTFLHEGLQRKLKEFLDEKSELMQIFLTTHSKVFIDTFEMKNTVLLNAKYSVKPSVRKKTDIDVMETFSIDINTDDGYKLICEHLGIEEKSYEILEKFNLLVEGNCDRKYILELCKFFKFKEVNIISANGADPMMKYLEFYESYYKNNESYKPQIRIILDNDAKGRDVFKKIGAKKFKNILINLMLIPNFLGDSNIELEKNNTNNEIEDFLYPEVLCELINQLLRKKGMKMLCTKQVCKKINTPAFKNNGILQLCEHSKNEKNPQNGNDISFVSSNESTNRIKEGLAGLFNIEGNRNLIKVLNDCKEKYPKVKENLIRIIETLENN
ncbi:hypothetical protein DVW12_14755 [Clostridium botulinum]|nr:hypothetical protein [Clostridium botulinum]